MLSVFSPSSTVHFFCVGTRSTDHRPDNNSSSAQNVLTSSLFLQHHNPAAQQQQQWAQLARVDDRTAAIKVDLSQISIDHMTTPRSHHNHFSPCCFFCILLSVIQHCHCSSCAQRSAPTAAAGRVLCACGRSAQCAQYSFSLLLSSALAYARNFRNVCPAFLLGTDHRRIDMLIDSSTTKTNRSYSTSIVYSSVRAKHTFSSY